MQLSADRRDALKAAEFAALMDGLGPFETQPLVAVAVSGGADSLATALLLREWVAGRGGGVLGLVVDHGLRAESAAEADLTLRRLAGIGIPAEKLTLTDLARGPSLAERARLSRHRVLEAECARRGILHLVFGHHAGDQAETVAMRLLAGSAEAGLAGMAALVETLSVRRLRPLLAIPPERLRATLRAAGIDWVEDPSNRDPSQQRARLRALRSDPAGDGLATRALVLSAQARGVARARREAEIAEELAQNVAIYPHGYAHLRQSRLSPEALAALVGMISGANFPVSVERLRDLAADLRPGTLAGVQLVPAGRYGPGLLMVREPAACEGAVPAREAVLWDGRWRLSTAVPEGCDVGCWGDDTPRLREILPMIIARCLPVLRRNGVLLTKYPAVLHEFVFSPARSAASAPFFPLPGSI